MFGWCPAQSGVLCFWPLVGIGVSGAWHWGDGSLCAIVVSESVVCGMLVCVDSVGLRSGWSVGVVSGSELGVDACCCGFGWARLSVSTSCGVSKLCVGRVCEFDWVHCFLKSISL